MKKTIKTLLLFSIVASFLMFNFVSCSRKSDSSMPTLHIEELVATPGDTVKMVVKIINSPGFLTMAICIDYDASVMQLECVENGESFQDYLFVPPKKMNSGCTACWLSTSEAEMKDGELAVLSFHINGSAENGKYPIRIWCPEDGGVVTGEKTPFSVNDAKGMLQIKSK